MGRIILLSLGGIAIVVISFFGTLKVLDFMDARADASRLQNARILMASLERYRAEKGTYPILPDGPVTALGAPLGAAVPANPSGAEEMHYASFDGKTFGLWIHFKTAAPCKIVVGGPSNGWWGQTAVCPIS